MNRVVVIALSLTLATPLAHAEQVSVDASGADGQPGASGSSYSPAPGGSGRDGGHAGSSTPGANAANVDIYLSDPHSAQLQQGNLQIRSLVYPNNERSSTLQPSGARIVVTAQGGRGGEGGRGGDAEGGTNGRNGSDATRYSSGRNGTNGGAGGRGGDGTPGSDGGRGGKVRVIVPANQSYLSLLVEANVKGGSGGNSGSNGRGGEGGRGGRGGSSYSWSETVQRGTKSETYYETESYTTTEPNGNGTSRTVSRTRSVPRSRQVPNMVTERHTNPGGADGSNGPDGPSGNGNVRPGMPGADGSIEFVVQQPDGSQTSFARTSSLILNSYDVIDQDGNGIIEAGEKVTIENISVKNVGDIEIPSGQVKTLVFLGSSQWILADPVRLEVPGLRAGESHTFTQALSFQVKNAPRVGEDSRWQARDEILPRAEVTRIDYRYGKFMLPKVLTVTYPIEVSPVEMVGTVGLGEKVPLSFRIRNLSTKSFGEEANGRRIGVSLYGRGPLFENESVSLRWADGESPASPDVLRQLLQLKAGEELVLKGEFQASPSAPPYSEVKVEHGLSLTPFGGGEVQGVQHGSKPVRLVSIYLPTPSTDVLLLTNSKTRQDSFLAWTQLLQGMGLQSTTWDLGYYKSFQLPPKRGAGSVAADFADKTLIVLNNSADEQRATSLIPPEHFIWAARKHNLHMLVLGGVENDIAGQMLRIKHANTETRKSPEEILQALAENNENPNTRYECPLIGYDTLLGDDTAESLVKAFEAKLREQFPGERFLVERKGAVQQLQWGVYSNTVDFGTLMVSRVFSPLSGRSVFLPLEDEELHAPFNSDGLDDARALVLSLRFGQKLKAYKHLSTQTEGQMLAGKISSAWLLKLLGQGIVSDVVNEISFSVSANNEATPNLDAFLALAAQTNGLAREAAGIEFFAATLRSEVGGPTAKALQKKVLAAKGNTDTSAALKAWEQKAAKRAKVLVHLSRVENVRRMLGLPANYRVQNSNEFLLTTNAVETGN